MDYIEQDDSMPAFIRDVKAYYNKQVDFHYQHSSAIRFLEEKNIKMEKRIELLEKKIKLLTSN